MTDGIQKNSPSLYSRLVTNEFMWFFSIRTAYDIYDYNILHSQQSNISCITFSCLKENNYFFIVVKQSNVMNVFLYLVL